MYCKKCGQLVDDESKFCKVCGAELFEAETLKVKKEKNPFFISLLIILPVQIICLILTSIPGVFGSVVFAIALILLLPIFVLSIISAVKAKKYSKYNGRVFSIILAVLTSLMIFTVTVSLIISELDKSETDIGIETTAETSVELLRASMKDPNSMQINRIAAKVYRNNVLVYKDGVLLNPDEAFKGYYIIYIDYSGKNGFGGVTRTCHYFKYNESFHLIDNGELEEMPAANDGKLVELNANRYN